MTRLSSEQRRAAIIRAAVRVIARDGLGAATTRAIAAEARMPLASFHYAFHSRNEMIRELIAFVLENERLAVLGSLQPGADIRTSVRAGIQAYFDIVVLEPGREQAMFELLHFALRTPDLDDLPRLQYESYHRVVREILVAGADHAGIEWSLPVADLARLAVALTDGLTLAWLADRDAEAAGRLMDSMADALAGFARPPATSNRSSARIKEHSA
ncbi:TetR/AcrR family transcriptional regulator [Parafrigoribacterium soli]|uniref:TetR/AcrR family transcriptional regulator n=1 Tax=Parafrigoribacterium soli TaxID=3144663 RepID=UPI0032EB5A8D